MVMLRCKTRRRVQLATNVCLLISKNRRSDWIDRVTAAGRPDFPLDQSEIIEFPNSMLAYQAGADGLVWLLAKSLCSAPNSRRRH
jgi:hypothetical protein